MKGTRIFAALLCVLALLVLTAPLALAEAEPDLRDIQDQDKVIVADEEGAVRVGEDVQARTNFYFRWAPGPDSGKVTEAGNLPKTGDSGPSLETVLILALAFGTGYLICDRYGKRTAQ